MNSELNDPNEPENDAMFCFMVQGEQRVGKAYAYLNAPDENVARARMVPLFPDCELIPFEASHGSVAW